MKKLLFLLTTLCSTALNNSVDANNKLSSIFEDSWDNTDDTEDMVIESDSSSKNQMNILESKKLIDAANLITLQDVESLEQIYKNDTDSLKDSVINMKKHPSRHNIMKCYLKIKEVFAHFNDEQGKVINVDNSILDLTNENELVFNKKFNIKLESITSFLRNFQNNILPQIYETPIDTSKYCNELKWIVYDNNYLNSMYEVYMNGINDISNKINKKIFKLKNCMEFLRNNLVKLKKCIIKNKNFIESEKIPSILKMLDDLEEAINNKKYYKIINMDIDIPLLQFDTFENEIIITIGEMYNLMRNIIVDFRSFSNWLYYFMKQVHEKYDEPNNEDLKTVGKSIVTKYYISYIKPSLNELKQLVINSKNINSQEISNFTNVLGNLEEQINKNKLDNTTYLPLRDIIFTLGNRIDDSIYAQNLVIVIRDLIKSICDTNNSYNMNNTLNLKRIIEEIELAN